MTYKIMDIINTRRLGLIEKEDGASTVWRLPVEMLHQIFIHCLPNTDHLKVSPNMAPILLTRICRRWREIAMDMPGLWCRLFVKVRSDHEDWEQAALWYGLWLQRSQGLPLSLSIYSLPSEAAKLQNLLQPYTTQISSLLLLSENAAIAAEFPFEDLPGLQDLTLSWRDNYRNVTNFARSISRLPCALRNLKLKRITVNPFESLSTCSVWTNLTSVEIMIYQAHESLDLLNLCPNLSSLNIGLGVEVVQPLKACMHTNLQYLSIWSSTWVRYPPGDLFNALTLPSLRILEAYYVGWPHEDFKAFLARSTHPSESLIFGAGMTVTDEEQAEYRALIPSLEVKWRNYLV
ncbi:hypothetical protein K503DRAFT_560057 [Rhizopogon vinicolor AM-OR11-026]|uniref:F-box domain-containing protein n=1 Tax=Rhizopogon vinicolor AM-OR11-026 TaxID=1314800 RepID=A0A1B7MK97_9AGAM|nr:hypothetical protein K503DRAFT_560057 [Rhizopogon vinicolor AM-OR11-026]